MIRSWNEWNRDSFYFNPNFLLKAEHKTRFPNKIVNINVLKFINGK